MTAKPARKPTPAEMMHSASLVLADAQGVLRWYASQAKALANAWAAPDNALAIVRAAKPMAEDAGKRAERALAQREMDKP